MADGMLGRDLLFELFIALACELDIADGLTNLVNNPVPNVDAWGGACIED